MQGQSSTKYRLHASVYHNMLVISNACFEFVLIDPYGNEMYKPMINVFIRLYKCMQREYLLLLLWCLF